MPLEAWGNFRRRPDATAAQNDWAVWSQRFMAEVVKAEPRLRVILRSYVDPALIAPEHVKESLRSRVSDPEDTKYWVGMYECDVCKRKVGHNARLIHHCPTCPKDCAVNHVLQRTSITHRGIIKAWKPTYRLFIGPAEEIKGLGELGYTIAVTAGLQDLLFGYDALFVRDGVLVHPVNGVEFSTGLPADMALAAVKFVDWYKKLDREALDPEGTTEEAERKEQLARAAAARDFIKSGGSIPKGIRPQPRQQPRKAIEK